MVFRLKWAKIQICVIYFIVVIKNNNKVTHYKYTNKTNRGLCSGTIGVFSRAFNKLNEQI